MYTDVFFYMKQHLLIHTFYLFMRIPYATTDPDWLRYRCLKEEKMQILKESQANTKIIKVQGVM